MNGLCRQDNVASFLVAVRSKLHTRVENRIVRRFSIDYKLDNVHILCFYSMCYHRQMCSRRQGNDTVDVTCFLVAVKTKLCTSIENNSMCKDLYRL